MKSTDIHFYSPAENSVAKEKSAPKPVSITGHISTGGKLVFPNKSIAQLPFDAETVRFQIGSQGGKRKIKSLYLITASEDQADAFSLVKAAKSYTIPLALILQKGGIDYADTKYTFVVKPFTYQDNMPGYELILKNNKPKPVYTGKPRGRKPKTENTPA